MKKTILLIACLCGSFSAIAQEELKQADEMAAAGNYDGASIMYRICMESNEQCALRLFKLIYEGKIEAQFSDELYQIINPLAGKGNAEAQFYLGELYRKGMGGVAQNDVEALKWLRLSAEKDYAEAKSALEKLRPKEEPVQEVEKKQRPRKYMKTKKKRTAHRQVKKIRCININGCRLS